MSMELDFTTYRSKVLGCWLGKAVGGTLGGPVEGKGGPLELTFYDPVPDRMLPNDDLDLQVVWLQALRRNGLPVDRRILAEAWLENNHLWPDEYGVAVRNLSRGIYPPASGAFDNGFTAGMGSAIRSELWACLAPGDPELAAALAREDACVDHHGEGIHAEVFLAVLESAAFLDSDREALLDTALVFIPDECRVARAVAEARNGWADCGDWREVRRRILDRHGRQNFTDVAQNLAFIVLGWLAGENFGARICTAVNCGKDTDCTGATLGALLGIIDPDSIEERWLQPIGRDLVLSPGMVGMHHPATLDEFTDQVVAMAVQVQEYYGSRTRLTGTPARNGATGGQRPSRGRHVARLPEDVPANEALIASEPLSVSVTYPPGVAMRPGRRHPLKLRVANPSERAVAVAMEVRVPDGWQVEAETMDATLLPGHALTLAAEVTPPGAEKVRPHFNPLDLWFHSEGLNWRATAGMELTIPWRWWQGDATDDGCPSVPESAELVEACGHCQRLRPGAWFVATDVKLPYRHTLRYIVQAPRTVRLWIDGELAHSHDGQHRVPAIHRAGPTGVDIDCQRGWHRLVIGIDDGPDGELFFGLGDGQSWDWLRDAEHRDPSSA